MERVGKEEKMSEKEGKNTERKERNGKIYKQ